MSLTAAIGTTGTCRRCGEPIEYHDSWESPLWIHTERYGAWPAWCDPKLCLAESTPSINHSKKETK